MRLRDRNVRHDIRVNTFSVAGIDCRGRITIGRAVRDSAIGVKRTCSQNRADFGERATRRVSQ